MKTLNLTCLIVALGAMICTSARGQGAQNAMLISTNVIKTNVGLKVKTFKSIDLSEYGTSDQEKIQTLLASLKARADDGPLEFQCEDADRTKPRQLKYLNLIDDRAFEVTRNKDINLSLWGVSGELTKHDILIQANFWAFRDCDCPDKTATRALVGMVMYIHISSLDVKLKSLSLPNISAAVQLGKATAEYHLQMYGVTEAIDFANLPSLGDLSVENYSKIVNAWDGLKRSLKTDSKVDPVIVKNIIRVSPSI